MREEHYTHGWLPAVLPAGARRFRVADQALTEVLASVGAEIVEEEPEVEIVAWPESVRADAPVAVVTVDPPPLRDGSLLQRGAQRLTTSLQTRARAGKAKQLLRDSGYRSSVFLWDVAQRADLPLVSATGRRLSERLPRRAIALGRRGEGGPTALEAALAEAEQAAGMPLRPDWASIRAGIVLVAAGPAILRVAIGRAARTQIHDQIAALEALQRADYPPAVADRIPRVIADGRVGLADWSLERRLAGARPSRELGTDLVEECFEFLVALRRAGGPTESGPTFSELVAGPLSVCRPETAGTLRALGGELDRSLAGLDRGFAHGDFFAGNLLTENGDLTGVIDWDAGGPGRVPALDLLHLQLTQQPYGSDDEWGRAVVERLLPSARAGGDELLRRYCAELGIDAKPRLLEGLVFAYWLEYAAYQLRTHLDRRSQPEWIEGNVELVARASEGFTKRTPGPDDREARTRTA